MKFIDFAKHDQRRGCCGDADVFEDFIVDGDLAKALEEKHRVFAAVRVKGDDCGDLPPGERLAKQAYARADFDFATLHKILEESDLKPRKNDRGDAFDSGAGDHKMHSYFTFGLFTHGGVQGITKLTVEYPHLSRYLNHFASLRLGANATWTSVSIGKNVNAKVHRDYNHLRDFVDPRTTRVALDKVKEEAYGWRTEISTSRTPRRPASSGNEALVALGYYLVAPTPPTRYSSLSTRTSTVPRVLGAETGGL